MTNPHISARARGLIDELVRATEEAVRYTAAVAHRDGRSETVNALRSASDRQRVAKHYLVEYIAQLESFSSSLPERKR